MNTTDPAAPIYAMVRQAIWILPWFMGLMAFKILLVPKLRGMSGEASVARILSRIAEDAVHDIVLVDKKGRRTQIDHVARMPGGLLVIETKNYSGWIFGQARDRNWTQKLRRTTNRFLNPLIQNKQHIEAVELASPGVPVVGWVVFTNDSTFPKGMPDGVSQLRTFTHDIVDILPRAPGNPNLATAWRRLKNPKLGSKDEKRSHLAELRGRHGPDRRTQFGWGLLMAAIIVSITILVTTPRNPSPPSPAARTQTQHSNHLSESTVLAPVVITAAPAKTWQAPRQSRQVLPTRPPARAAPPTGKANQDRQKPNSKSASTPASIEWSTKGDSTPKASASQACINAKMDLLINYSAENIARRNLACGSQ